MSRLLSLREIRNSSAAQHVHRHKTPSNRILQEKMFASTNDRSESLVTVKLQPPCPGEQTTSSWVPLMQQKKQFAASKSAQSKLPCICAQPGHLTLEHLHVKPFHYSSCRQIGHKSEMCAHENCGYFRGSSARTRGCPHPRQSPPHAASSQPACHIWPASCYQTPGTPVCPAAPPQ